MSRPLIAQPRALFVGLCTLDIIYSVTHVPTANEKMTALRQTVAAGGPATNAAVTFAHLGGHATLITGIADHPLTAGMRADLGHTGVFLMDVSGGDSEAPPISSIMVTSESGERAVVSLNATGRTVTPPTQLDALASASRTVLIDGHHPELALAAARIGREHGQLCILDGGSWKENTHDLLSYIDIAVCSADFHPPGISTADDTLDYLLDNGVKWAAITNGAGPITWASVGKRAEVPVPEVKVVNTLGAGDIFHGAFTHAICEAHNVNAASFVFALQQGAKVAAHACRYFGTRAWMTSETTDQLA